MSYYNSKGEVMTAAAFYALLAAKKRSSIGRYASQRYYQKMSGNTSLHLYRLACQLLAEKAEQRLADHRRKQDAEERELMRRASADTQASNLLDFLQYRYTGSFL